MFVKHSLLGNILRILFVLIVVLDGLLLVPVLLGGRGVAAGAPDAVSTRLMSDRQDFSIKKVLFNNWIKTFRLNLIFDFPDGYALYYKLYVMFYAE